MIWHVFFLLAQFCYPCKPILEFPDLLPSGAVWVAIATRTTSWVLFGPAQLLPSGAESEHFLCSFTMLLPTRLGSVVFKAAQIPPKPELNFEICHVNI